MCIFIGRMGVYHQHMAPCCDFSCIYFYGIILFSCTFHVCVFMCISHSAVALCDIHINILTYFITIITYIFHTHILHLTFEEISVKNK